MDRTGSPRPRSAQLAWRAFVNSDAAEVSVLGHDPANPRFDEDGDHLIHAPLRQRRIEPGSVPEILRRSDDALVLCGYNRTGPWQQVERHVHSAPVDHRTTQPTV